MEEEEQQYHRREADKILDELIVNIKYIRRDLDKIMEQLERDYVTQDQFDPVKKIVYGLVSLILIAVVGALITLVIR